MRWRSNGDSIVLGGDDDDGGHDAQEEESALSKEDVAFLETRSRVHLTLSWISGNTLWLEDFPAAYQHVTGLNFEACASSSTSSRTSSAADAVEAFLSEMRPHTCEIFTRYVKDTGARKKAVTLARGGGVPSVYQNTM